MVCLQVSSDYHRHDGENDKKNLEISGSALKWRGNVWRKRRRWIDTFYLVQWIIFIPIWGQSSFICFICFDDEEEEVDSDYMNYLKVTLARRARDIAEAENKLLQEKNKYVANLLFARNEQCGPWIMNISFFLVNFCFPVIVWTFLCCRELFIVDGWPFTADVNFFIYFFRQLLNSALSSDGWIFQRKPRDLNFSSKQEMLNFSWNSLQKREVITRERQRACF